MEYRPLPMNYLPHYFRVIKESGEHDEDFEAIKKDIMRKPFQVVAANYAFQ